MGADATDQILPTFKVTARELAPEDNYVGWSEALGSLFDIDLNGIGKATEFRGDLASYFMGPIVLGTGDCTAQHYGRNARTIAKSGIDPLLIQLYTRGGFEGTADGREITVKTGDVCVLDMARGLETSSPRSANVTLIIPRALLAPLVQDADALHGAVLGANSPLGGVLADYLRSLHAHIENLTFAEANTLTAGTVTLAAACLGPYADRKEETNAALKSALLVQIRRHIEANVASPELTAESLCARFAISRASLYRLFEPLGGVINYVRKRRLYHSLLEITSPANAHKQINEIAYGLGFTNESNFGRAFRAAYGVTPGEARETPVSAWGHASRKGAERQNESMLSHWIREISR